MKLLPIGWACLLSIVQGLAADPAPSLVISPSRPSGVWQTGEKIVWNVSYTGGNATTPPKISYVIKRNGADNVRRDQVNLNNGTGTIEAQADGPSTLLLEATASQPGKPVLRTAAGAAIEPWQITRSAPLPEDFDSFWDSMVNSMASTPPEATLEKVESGRSGVEYWKVTLKGYDGTQVRGQIARPVGGNKLPALVVFQWAGVYPLKKEWVVDRAAEGWLALNIMAHDLPIDEAQPFYDHEASTALNNYASIGNDDREKSYFLRMFLACYQAIEYLTQRPDWDGRNLLATGGSQGALQALAAAALHPAVTGVTALVPAGCDHTGREAGRQPGWPFWIANAGSGKPEAVFETSRYFDAVNFAHRIKCPVLIGLGLIDTTSPPSGVFALVNQLQCPREVVIMPASDHGGTKNSQAPFQTRAGAWRRAVLEGKSIPLISWTKESTLPAQ